MPGERGPKAVPMMELPAKCALTISLSKYSSRKSAALMVQKRSVSYMRASPRLWRRLPRYSNSFRSRGLNEVGSGGSRISSGLMNLH